MMHKPHYPKRPTIRSESAALLSEDVGAAWAALRANFSNPELSPQARGNPQPFIDLQAAYVMLGLPWHAAYAAQQAERLAPGAAKALQPVNGWASARGGAGIWGESVDAVFVRAQAHWPHLGEIAAQLEALVKQACANDWLTWLYLTYLRSILEPQDLARQKDAVNKAIAFEPMVGETAHLLGRWRLLSGNAAGAAAAAQAAITQVPGRYSSWLLHAQALMQLGRHTEAHQSFVRASASPNVPFLGWLAEVLYRNNLAEQALAVRQRVVSLAPAEPQHWMALAVAQSQLWRTQEAKASVAKALALSPGDPALEQMGKDLSSRAISREQFDQELAFLQCEGLRNNGVGSARLLMQSLYQDHVSAQVVADLHRQIGAGLIAQLDPVEPPRFENRLSLQRRLRVGYVSGDLHRQHPVNVFMLPVLLHHNHNEIEVFVYHTGHMFDEYTRQARQSADHWRECSTLSDRALRELILQDQVDVLVDLAGHTATHRLGVFGLRAAPVQLSYLGYPHSTGLPCIDAMLVDDVVAPASHAHLFTERLLHLPNSVFCWSPVDDYPLRERVEPPVRGAVVFGSFNNLLKLSDKTLRLWARVLKAVPDAVLLLKAPVLADAAICEQTLARFAAQGINAQRLQLRGPVELGAMMQEYHDVHIALDPTPYNGGTTSLQALWMGTPLVTCLGDNFVSRMGASFVQRIGHPEWVAHNEDEYVAIATRLAAQRQSQPWSRHDLREQMRSSPVCDIVSHTRGIEAAYRRAWCEYVTTLSAAQGEA